MVRRRISPEFRARLSEKLMDLGNFVAVGLIIGQFTSSGEFSFELLELGAAAMLLCYLASYIISS